MSQMWGGTTNENGYGGMMGGMMGQTPAPTATNTFLPYFGILFTVLIGVTVLGLIGVAYYLVYPQIRMGTLQQPPVTLTTAEGSDISAYESVSKTLTNEEREVISALQNHNGTYLQKYIKAETGLSRLKTHRIIARLANRGIVSLEKVGNTNQVTLADWLNKQA
jgi:uncharacterized membrane protein